MNYDMKQSGDRIRQLRKKKGYTQEQLAVLLNIDRSLLSHIEAGKKGCSIDLLVQLSCFFRVSLDYLVLGILHTDLPGYQDLDQMSDEVTALIEHLELFKRALTPPM